ncbi:MAG: hypothetical protein V3V08_15120 [Nannocystaceae bacterium]
MHRAFALLAPLLVTSVFIAACPYGDVGAPCNHGKIAPPSTPLVTFPALSCDELLCIYAQDLNLPDVACSKNSDCFSGQQEGVYCQREDGEAGSCKIKTEYVLERSMCSKKCASEADCENSGPRDRPVAKETTCLNGFACARIQKLGEFCCEKLCICKDDLKDTGPLDRECGETKKACTTNEDDE